MSVDRGAYADLVRAHHGRVLRLCQILLSNPTEAEDAAQDVFIKAYSSFSSFRGDASFLTWISRIAHNHCMDLLRQRSRRKTDSLEHVAENQLPAVPAAEASAIEGLLADLRPEHKEILALREVAGLRYDEIAATLHCSLDAVKARLRRARQELQQKARHFLGPTNV